MKKTTGDRKWKKSWGASENEKDTVQITKDASQEDGSEMESEQEVEDVLNAAVDAEEFEDRRIDQRELDQFLEKRRGELLMNFLKKYRERSIEPYYKSAKTKDLRIEKTKVFYNVVGDTYDEIVEQSNESFLLLVCLRSLDSCTEMQKSVREIGMHLMAYGNCF